MREIIRQAFMEARPSLKAARRIREFFLSVLFLSMLLVWILDQFSSWKQSQRFWYQHQSNCMANATKSVISNINIEASRKHISSASQKALIGYDIQSEPRLYDAWERILTVNTPTDNSTVFITSFGRDGIKGGRRLNADWHYAISHLDNEKLLVEIRASPNPKLAYAELSKALEKMRESGVLPSNVALTIKPPGADTLDTNR